MNEYRKYLCCKLREEVARLNAELKLKDEELNRLRQFDSSRTDGSYPDEYIYT